MAFPDPYSGQAEKRHPRSFTIVTRLKGWQQYGSSKIQKSLLGERRIGAVDLHINAEERPINESIRIAESLRI